MNGPSPFIPQRSLLEQENAKKRSTLRYVVFGILALHVVVVLGILLFGCQQDGQKTGASSQAPAVSLATNAPTLAPPTLAAREQLPSTPPVTEPLAPRRSATQTPTLPTTTASAPSPPSPAKSYSVVKGDTFSKIAHANHVSVRALAKANPGVEAAKLRAGQVLQIPVASEPHGAPATQRQPGAAESDVVLYEIKPGDTLSKIANAHGTTVKALQAANKLKSDALVIGQKLKLPDPKVTKSPASPSPALQP